MFPQEGNKTKGKHYRIDLFRLSILFSQYRSCDDTQESRTFSSSHAGFLMNTTKVQTSEVSSHDLFWENKFDKRKRSVMVDEYGATTKH